MTRYEIHHNGKIITRGVPQTNLIDAMEFARKRYSGTSAKLVETRYREEWSNKYHIDLKKNEG